MAHSLLYISLFSIYHGYLLSFSQLVLSILLEHYLQPLPENHLLVKRNNLLISWCPSIYLKLRFYLILGTSCRPFGWAAYSLALVQFRGSLRFQNCYLTESDSKYSLGRDRLFLLKFQYWPWEALSQSLTVQNDLQQNEYIYLSIHLSLSTVNYNYCFHSVSSLVWTQFGMLQENGNSD